FQGGDLSSDPGIEIRIEDHYYDRTDAAVVFQWRDRGSGRVRYIYHGNDGTRMPWNDTAQLDYLNSEVREAVMQQILAVARRSPIIRFDAAMTLAKKHYQRLWFPEPGSGGDIPSRAGQGMSKAEFDRRMPIEFFREVVDRIAQEAPGTLLLAEAFWLMEGYFVRTLGMHRVYNSAFMNFLKNEQNDRFRQSVKNVLDFQPEILRRYVNFLNNPDEETAVAQFGKGDKYFGICLMMVTMPGLPMFGHGQIEGYAEKYGMEYRRAYWDEREDDHLIARHEHEIFPFLRRRALFAGVDHFQLFDFTTAGGQVDENVFAYSNRYGVERALVVVHNRYAETTGWVHIAVGKVERSGPGGEPRQVRRSLGEALGLRGGDHDFVIFRETISGLEYIRRSGEVASRGLSFSLHAYDRRVLLDWREVEDPNGTLAAIESFLAGRGT
ncbi:MAG TPA: alpha-amylase, partial [Candidatus Aminicenantes bacterium]|nr:alpha-amylase [Candidatus Aminicenantes bacterium]